MQQKTIQAGLTFPSTFELIDYSLLNPFDFKSVIGEYKFFKENPGVG